jgi:hypothetical protein
MTKTFTVANWNLQIFGDTKASNLELMELYVEKINQFDIFFIQEIRDDDSDSFDALCEMLSNYSCEISSRAGRSTSKEQYGIFYKDWINITEIYDYNPDSENRWERPPIAAKFRLENYSITMINIHTKPDDVPNEMSNLFDVAKDYEGNILILGDLNADCKYFNIENSDAFKEWHWTIGDDEDTTVADTDCAYDRIILNDYAYFEFKKSHIDTENIVDGVSDHYLVWAEMYYE